MSDQGLFAMVQAIKNLKDATGPAHTPITKLNQHELFEIRDLADSLGPPLIFDAVITLLTTGTRPAQLRADDEILESSGESGTSTSTTAALSKPCGSEGWRPTAALGAGVHARPAGTLPCVAFRQAGNILEVERFEDIDEISALRKSGSGRRGDSADRSARNGKYVQFCLGVAEPDGDPRLYPQVEVNPGRSEGLRAAANRGAGAEIGLKWDFLRRITTARADSICV
jgi:hypothetical protein